MMDLIDRLNDLVNKVRRQLDHVKTEEAVKNAFIMPLLAALGYDVFNPTEVIPEHIADHSVKKGEKVDYAIKIDGKIVMIIECKQVNADLEFRHAGQLFRYFSVVDAKFGILTDGVRYLFYTDLEKPNVMDSRPFFEFNLTDFNDNTVEQLKKFSRATFDADVITSTASDMKITKAVLAELRTEFTSPSEELVKVLHNRVAPNERFTSSVRESFTALTKKAMESMLKDMVNQRLMAAVETEREDETVAASVANELPGEETNGIITTPDEEGAHRIIQAIASEIADPEDITLRDAQSYCAVLYKNNNRNPVARLFFDRKKSKQIVIFDSESGSKHDLANITDITKLKAQILAAVRQYLGEGDRS